MHSIKHAPNDVLRWGDTENMNVEGPENLCKEWVKEQRGKTNQSPTLHKTPMTHCLRKEALCYRRQFKVKNVYFIQICIFVRFVHICTYFAYIAYFAYFLPLFLTARLVDDDLGYRSDAWTQHDHRAGQAQQLRADSWHLTPSEEVIDGDNVFGIKTQMWMRAMKRTLMTHCLSGGGTHNIGYDAVRWENIVHGNCGEYGRYHELSVLPDKIARYLFDFDSDSYASLRLPEIPED